MCQWKWQNLRQKMRWKKWELNGFYEMFYMAMQKLFLAFCYFVILYRKRFNGVFTFFRFFFSIFIANHFIRQIIDHFPYFWLATWFLMAFHCIPLFTLSKLTSLLVRHITIEPEETLFTWSILDIEVLINVRYKK